MTQEIDRLISQALRAQDGSGSRDMEALELAVRGSMHQIGATLLGQLLNADDGDHRGPRVDCGKGHQAEFVGYRTKTVTTVLAPVQLRRSYYYCAECEAGVVPKDQALDVVATLFSPGVRRLMARVGAKESFEQGRVDLEELAGISVETKQVERVAEATGQQLRVFAEAEAQAALAGKLMAVNPANRMYIAIDGTGVPMVPWEVEDCAGKAPDGRAKTREVKLGCVFTQSRCDAQGRPVRDEHSTTYVGAIETAEHFGWRIYAEAVRRGVQQAKQTVVLGDGAPWIWNLAGEHFPGAIEIIDLYHAREHVSDIGKVLHGPGTAAARRWITKRYEQLDAGQVEAIIQALGRLQPGDAQAQEEVRRAIGYFETNAHRMRFDRFRDQGLFIGSGVVEAGCKTIVSQRLKQSGMHWSVRGANQIIALRCCQLSGRWEEFWENRATA